MTFPDLPATRCAGCAPLYARAGLIGLCLAILFGLWTGVATPQSLLAHPGGLIGGDGALYARIVDDVAGGRSYYDAATAEQRRWRYALKPVFTVREPTLAVALAALPNAPVRRTALVVLALATMAAWGWRLQRQYGSLPFSALAVVSLLCATSFAWFGQSYLFHECWAGLLMALSLALHDSRRWGWSWALGVLAVFVRELAAPYLVVMAVFALWERRPKEAAAWIFGLAALAGFLWLHAGLVASRVLPGDIVSPGWLAFGGWSYSLLTAHWNALLVLTPDWVTVVVVPLMGLGAILWPGGTGRRLAVLCLGYALGFTVCGRLNTSYWGLIIVPLMGLSLAMVPGGLLQLVRAARARDDAGMR